MARRLTVAEWCTWLACAVAALAALLVVIVPLGGTNRGLGVALVFAIAAVALAGNGLLWQRSFWAGVALFAVGGLALAYGIILALSVPLRLAVEGTCPLSVPNCPLGYEHPLTGAEGVVVYTSTILGALALVFVFAAVEVRHVRRGRPRSDQSGPPAR